MDTVCLYCGYVVVVFVTLIVVLVAFSSVASHFRALLNDTDVFYNMAVFYAYRARKKFKRNTSLYRLWTATFRHHHRQKVHKVRTEIDALKNEIAQLKLDIDFAIDALCDNSRDVFDCHDLAIRSLKQSKNK